MEESDPRDPITEEPEPFARRLLAEGYNGALVASRLVRDLGLGQAEADALVQRVGGGKINVERQRGQFAALGGAALFTFGALLLLPAWEPPGSSRHFDLRWMENLAGAEHDYVFLAGALVLMALGVVRVLVGLSRMRRAK